MYVYAYAYAYACNGYLLQGFTSTNRDGMCEVISSDLIEPILSLLSLHLFAQLPLVDVIPFSSISPYRSETDEENY